MRNMFVVQISLGEQSLVSVNLQSSLQYIIHQVQEIQTPSQCSLKLCYNFLWN